MRRLKGRGKALASGCLLVSTSMLGAGAILVAPGKAAAGGGSGTLTGVVVNVATGRPQAGVRLILTGGSPAGDSPGLTRRAVTGKRGTYRFGGLPTGEESIFALDARYDGGLFAGRAITIAERGSVITSRLKVWETTTDPSVVEVVRDALFLVPDDDGVGVVESVVVANSSDEAYAGRGASIPSGAGAGDGPSLGYSLPAAADKTSLAIVESDLDLPQLLDSQFGFSITSAIPPGETRTTFSYRITGSGGAYDLSKTALYPTEDMYVYASEPLELEGNRLTAGGRERIGGRSYRAWTLEGGLDAGEVAQVNVTARASVLPGFAWGVAAVIAAVGAGMTVALARSRRGSHAARRRAPAGKSPRPRDDLVAAIAELDIRRRNDVVTEDEWRAERAALKATLAAASQDRAGQDPGGARPEPERST